MGLWVEVHQELLFAKDLEVGWHQVKSLWNLLHKVLSQVWKHLVHGFEDGAELDCVAPSGIGHCVDSGWLDALLVQLVHQVVAQLFALGSGRGLIIVVDILIHALLVLSLQPNCHGPTKSTCSSWSVSSKSFSVSNE